MESRYYDKLDELLEMAGKLHGSAQAHRDFTLRSMQEHVEEVRMLIDGNDVHWKAETTDILIHCLLLLRSAGVEAGEAEALLGRRLGRFQEKITGALLEQQRKSKLGESVYGKESPDSR
ncbi:MAG: hypothetical protein HGA80_08325 [Candidatus Omnitrophica bacterium]|nr:hypothetical protein [Candidatus Omnitrophota bacterium]